MATTKEDQPAWSLVHGDAVERLAELDEDVPARLVFADPPYNIGIDYGQDQAADLLPAEVYLQFCGDWIAGCRRNLTDDGSFWLLVSDEYAAELCVEAKRQGLHLRNWIKWFEGVGVNCSNKFNRTTRHLLYFVVHPKRFVFHAHEVLRSSDRQTKYNDRRANSVGKVENDLWDIPRLTGTCAERIPGFPTQLPLELVDRVVRCASDPGDLVLDPFNDSGTTGEAAIKNGRRYIGIDASEEFIELARARLKVCGTATANGNPGHCENWSTNRRRHHDTNTIATPQAFYFADALAEPDDRYRPRLDCIGGRWRPRMAAR